MSRDRRLSLIDGDRCVDGRGNIGSARLCKRGRPDQFIGVRIIEGPDKGTWGKSYNFTPEIDHAGGTLAATCDRCDRPFKSRARVLGDLGGYTVPRDTLCLTCTGLSRVTRPDPEPEGYLGSEAHRTAHHARTK